MGQKESVKKQTYTHMFCWFLTKMPRWFSGEKDTLSTHSDGMTGHPYGGKRINFVHSLGQLRDCNLVTPFLDGASILCKSMGRYTQYILPLLTCQRGLPMKPKVWRWRVANAAQVGVEGVWATCWCSLPWPSGPSQTHSHIFHIYFILKWCIQYCWDCWAIKSKWQSNLTTCGPTTMFFLIPCITWAW